jgi:anti-sigma-K factor RskA
VNCEQFEEISGAYALGALDEREMREAEEHLRSCERHAEVRELALVASGLASAPPQMDPPPALKSRLMEAARAEAAPEVAAAPADQGGSLWETIRSWVAGPRFGYALAGGLAIVVAALLLWNVSLQSDDAGSAQTVVTLTGSASGQVIFLEDEGVAVMDVDGLEPLPADQVYQVWAISDGEAASLGFIEPAEDGQARTAMQLDLEDVDVIAVTVEQAPGAEQPTSDPIIQGTA